MDAIKTLEALDAVASISKPYGTRRYISMANTSRAARGDARKVYVDGNTIVAEPYRGYMSDGAIASLDAIEAAAIALGMTVTR